MLPDSSVSTPATAATPGDFDPGVNTAVEGVSRTHCYKRWYQVLGLRLFTYASIVTEVLKVLKAFVLVIFRLLVLWNVGSLSL